jgi:hypothetical protein
MSIADSKERLMFVVRVMEEGQEPDFKAFGDQASAQARFDEFSWRTLWDEEFESATLFDVSGNTDEGAAIDALSLIPRPPDEPRVDALGRPSAGLMRRCVV